MPDDLSGLADEIRQDLGMEPLYTLPLKQRFRVYSHIYTKHGRSQKDHLIGSYRYRFVARFVAWMWRQHYPGDSVYIVEIFSKTAIRKALPKARLVSEKSR